MNKKFVGIEFLRFGCAFAVLVWHYLHFYASFNGPVEPKLPFYETFRLFYHRGGYAVQIFWAISGFIFFWKYFARIQRGDVVAWDFFWLRVSRLYPLHIITLLAMLSLQAVYIWTHGMPYVVKFIDSYHFTLNVFFASGWGLEKGYSFNGPVWSVSVEVLVYVLFFVLAKRPWMGTPMMGAIVLWSFVVNRFIASNSIVECLMYFFLGGLVQRLYGWLEDLPMASVAMPVATLTSLVFVGVYAAKVDLVNVHGLPDEIARIFLLLPAVIIAALGVFKYCSPAVAGHVAFLGDMTYASYLLHFLLQTALVTMTDSVGLGRGVYDYRLSFCLFVFLTFYAAAKIYKHVEMPLQNHLRAIFLPVRLPAAVPLVHPGK